MKKEFNSEEFYLKSMEPIIVGNPFKKATAVNKSPVIHYEKTGWKIQWKFFLYLLYALLSLSSSVFTPILMAFYVNDLSAVASLYVSYGLIRFSFLFFEYAFGEYWLVKPLYKKIIES